MEQRIRELVDKLNEYSKAYYVLDAPKISDKEYDELYDELLRLEEQSGIILPDSPTQRVGGDPLPCFEPHTHIHRLWSLDKVRTRGGSYRLGQKGGADCGVAASSEGQIRS